MRGRVSVTDLLPRVASNGNLLAFFDLPGLDLAEYAEVLGGLHHLAISVTPRSGTT
jgi:hypothetical protein